ncbi:MAG: hypothetical protein J07HR59_01270 [Halorubrum sp. J07HR59]|nr:MAG: hypothetical protein J07HR59_01270 [Halorubrum sp. J07HR59]
MLCMQRRQVVVGFLVAVSPGCVTRRIPSGPRTPPEGNLDSTPRVGDSGGQDRSEEPATDTPTATTTSPTGDLRLQEWDFLEDETGLLRVEGVILNTVAERRDGEVVGEATTPDRTLETRLEVTVPPSETQEFAVTFDIEYAVFALDGQVTVRIE